MRDDPIARRHANGRDIDCHGFWRRLGGRFFLFLAVYPWVVAVLQTAAWIYRQSATPFGTLPPFLDNLLHSNWARDVGEAVILVLCLPGIFLLPVGLIWWVMAWNAYEKGLLSGRFCLVCSVLFFGGIAAIFLVPGLLARL